MRHKVRKETEFRSMSVAWPLELILTIREFDVQFDCKLMSGFPWPIIFKSEGTE
jgi:hypothetical protein